MPNTGFSAVSVMLPELRERYVLVTLEANFLNFSSFRSAVSSWMFTTLSPSVALVEPPVSW